MQWVTTSWTHSTITCQYIYTMTTLYIGHLLLKARPDEKTAHLQRYIFWMYYYIHNFSFIIFEKNKVIKDKNMLTLLVRIIKFSVHFNTCSRSA